METYSRCRKEAAVVSLWYYIDHSLNKSLYVFIMDHPMGIFHLKPLFSADCLFSVRVSDWLFLSGKTLFTIYRRQLPQFLLSNPKYCLEFKLAYSIVHVNGEIVSWQQTWKWRFAGLISLLYRGLYVCNRTYSVLAALSFIPRVPRICDSDVSDKCTMSAVVAIVWNVSGVILKLHYQVTVKLLIVSDFTNKSLMHVMDEFWTSDFPNDFLFLPLITRCMLTVWYWLSESQLETVQTLKSESTLDYLVHFTGASESTWITWFILQVLVRFDCI